MKYNWFASGPKLEVLDEKTVCMEKHRQEVLSTWMNNQLYGVEVVLHFVFKGVQSG